MSTVELTPTAERDLDSIWEYIAADNTAAADRILKQIGAVADLLSRQKGLGLRCDEWSEGLRQFPIRPYEYVLFYRPTAEGIRIIRVLHGRRDFPSVFRDDLPDK